MGILGLVIRVPVNTNSVLYIILLCYALHYMYDNHGRVTCGNRGCLFKHIACTCTMARYSKGYGVVHTNYTRTRATHVLTVHRHSTVAAVPGSACSRDSIKLTLAFFDQALKKGGKA